MFNPCTPLACGGSDETTAESQPLDQDQHKQQGSFSQHQAAAALTIVNPMNYGIKASILHGLKYRGFASHNGGDFHIQ